MKVFTNRGKPRFIGLSAGLLSLGLVAAACGGNGDTGTGDTGSGGDAADKKPITIASIGWNEDIVVNQIWKHILENKGYTVNIKTLGVAPIYQGLASGDIDLFLDAWLPNTHQDYWKQYGQDINKVGAWYQNGTLEWTVPQYMENVDSIADLQGMASKLNGEIIGIDPGAGITRVSKNKVIPQYNLGDSYTLKTSSTSGMLGALKRAYNAKEPIVVTLWHPHVAYTQYKLKDLKDPKGALGKGEKLWSLSRTDFPSDYPKVAKWLANFELSKQQLQDLEDLIFNNPQYKDNPAAGIDKWMKDPEHKQLVKEWTS